MRNRTKIAPGTKFGRLTVIEFQRDPARPKYPHYLCECECGATTHVTAANFTRTRSCGCLRIEELVARSRTHGLSNTNTFRIWVGMIERCVSKGSVSYPTYGARGISVCPRWRDSFANFLEDMGTRPSIQHSIDRIDNDKGYEPSNCRWATNQTQCNNKRRNFKITHNGRTLTPAEWSRETGIHQIGRASCRERE